MPGNGVRCTIRAQSAGLVCPLPLTSMSQILGRGSLYASTNHHLGDGRPGTLTLAPCNWPVELHKVLVKGNQRLAQRYRGETEAERPAIVSRRLVAAGFFSNVPFYLFYKTS